MPLCAKKDLQLIKNSFMNLSKFWLQRFYGLLYSLIQYNYAHHYPKLLIDEYGYLSNFNRAIR